MSATPRSSSATSSSDRFATMARVTDIGEAQDETAAVRRERERADEREAAVRDVIQTIARTTFDLDAVCQTVIDRAVRLCRADTGNLARRVGDTNEYRIAAFTSMTPEYEQLVRERVYTPEQGSIVGRTLLQKQVVHIEDVLRDPDYALLDLQKLAGYRTALGVPMLRGGEPIGAIAVARNQVRPFSDADIRLIETFADYVVIAMENVRLYQTVERQRTELARYAPQVANLLSSREGEQLLSGHRREITTLFCDLRGFTAFSETAEPEVVFRILREYHTAAGEVVSAHEGTIEHFAGDGLMAFFNDPIEIVDHELAAVRTAAMLARRFKSLAADWRKRGYDLSLGVGIATGYATLGRIGFEGRYEYGAIGNAVILASRLSDAAEPGEILLSQRTDAQLEGRIVTEPVPVLRLKGFSRPVVAMRFLELSD